jgi:hypothetical protein
VIEDITAADFDPMKYGVSMQVLIRQIHGVRPNGTLAEAWRYSVALMTQLVLAGGWRPRSGRS